MMRYAMTALAVSLIGGVAASGPCRAQEAENAIAEGDLFGASSAWTNESGSTMTLEFGPGNAVSGTYINRNEGFNCQNTPYPLTGWVVGNFISFSVAWDNVYENCNSVTAWSGFAEADGGSVQIVTLWTLAFQGPSGPEIENGKDAFRPLPKVDSESPLQ